jgi:hypothetical protein
MGISIPGQARNLKRSRSKYNMIGFNRGIMTGISGGTRFVTNDSNQRARGSFSAEIATVYNQNYYEYCVQPLRAQSSNSSYSGLIVNPVPLYSGAIVIGDPTPPGAINSIDHASMYPGAFVAAPVVDREVALLHGCTASDTPCGEDAEDACIICHENKAVIAFVPCGHMFTCIACTRALAKKECPTCRAAVTSALKIFK